MRNKNRGGTILIDKDGNRTVVRQPTKMVASGEKAAKSVVKKVNKKSEKK